MIWFKLTLCQVPLGLLTVFQTDVSHKVDVKIRQRRGELSEKLLLDPDQDDKYNINYNKIKYYSFLTVTQSALHN